MRRGIAVFALFFTFSVCALASPAAQDPMEWLGKISSAGQRLNYSGTFIYQSGKNFETSRIAHRVDAGGATERLEVLDGSPREVIRTNNEVICVLPEQRLVIVDQPNARRAFPARLPNAHASVLENYVVSMGEASRVAGQDTQLVLLKPRDALRYGHMFWADRSSGLLLKARMVDHEGEVIEQFTFSDVRIGGEIEASALEPRFVKDDDWKIVHAQGSPVRPETERWVIEDPLPGYALRSIVRRSLGRGDVDILHMVFGDGLAAISVFIEPLPPDGSDEGLGALATGPVNIYKRLVDGHLITVLGEVPMVAVQRLGDSIVPAAAK